MSVTDPPPEPPELAGIRPGPLRWMTSNSVAANLLMVALVVGGLIALSNIKREVFPEFELDLIVVNVPYPGASPAEVEQGVVLAIEEAVRGLDGVKEVRSSSVEGAGNVTIELLLGADRDRALSDIKTAVDRISSFPEDTERPIVSIVAGKRAVLSLIIYGETDDKTLRALAERTRNGLLQDPGITLVELSEKALEISIEVPQENLRRYNLTLDQVAGAIRAAAVELPGGGVKTLKGEVLLRMAERRDSAEEFERIVILSRPDGSEVRVSDIANVKDAFAETDRETTYNGKPAVTLNVYRVGEQGPIGVAAAVRQYIASQERLLPPGLQYAVWDDRSAMYKGRQDLLLKNSIMGLALVILVLGLFLDIRLSFWVTLGIPISFIGSLIFLPEFDVSINMISLFAFIVTLGMVVDDAIIVGEAVHKHGRDGMSPMQAAVAGVREVAMPVTFAILTTIIAFMPLLFVPGMAGKFFRNMPLVVIAVLAISWVESLFVLPAHLAEKKHIMTTIAAAPFKALDLMWRAVGGRSLIEAIVRQQQRFSRGVEWFVVHIYGRQLNWILRWRYLSIAAAIGALALTVGLIGGGRINFTFLPKIADDVVRATLVMPVGTPVDQTKEHQARMLETAREVLAEAGGEKTLSRGVVTEIGGASPGGATSPTRTGSGAGHLADVRVFLVPEDKRTLSSGEFARRWRDKLGQVVGAESITFKYSRGHSGGSPIHIRLSHIDNGVLEESAQKLANSIRGYAGVYDLDDGAAQGKEQLDFKLKPEARSLGIDQLAMARQVRSAFYGAEALRQQRGREELRVFVRRPLSERSSEHDVESLMIRTPEGGEVPLAQAATVSRGRAYTTIRRSNGRRTVDVKADVDSERGNAAEITAKLEGEVLPKLMADVPGLTYTLEGRGRERNEMMGDLGRGFIVAVICMFGLLAVAFRSYFQPAIVLLAIPFGMIGAVIGHVVMGYDLSLMTMFGVVALSGVVVNDSLILVVAINRYRAEGMSTFEAVMAGGQRRFRPIILTSLTTFLGLSPMILETSMQARFLIPMAISLGFGVLFATGLILAIVPCGYMMLDDFAALIGRVRTASARLAPPPAPAE